MSKSPSHSDTRASRLSQDDSPQEIQCKASNTDTERSNSDLANRENSTINDESEIQEATAEEFSTEGSETSPVVLTVSDVAIMAARAINPYASNQNTLSSQPETHVGNHGKSSHFLKDADGNLKTSGSAIRFLTRKFVDLLYSSRNGAIDLNMFAELLEKPNADVQDIANVLEAAGMIERRSENVVALRDSYAIFGDTSDTKAEKAMDQIRSEIAECQAEEALLDRCIKDFQEVPAAGHFICTSDIIQALCYPKDADSEILDSGNLANNSEDLINCSILAIHAPYEYLAYRLQPPKDESEKHRLFVGSKCGIAKAQGKMDEYYSLNHGVSDSKSKNNRKRKISNISLSRKAVKFPGTGDNIKIFVLPCRFDKQEKKLKSLGKQALAETISAFNTPDNLVVGESLPSSSEIVKMGTNAFIVVDHSFSPKSEHLEKTEAYQKNEGRFVNTISTWDIAEAISNGEGVSEYFS